MKMKALALAIALVPFVAQAADSGLYVGASFGQVEFESSVTNDISNEPGLNLDDKSNVYKLTAGYQFNQYFGAELVYATGIEYSLSHDVAPGKIEADVDMLGLNLVAQYPFADSFAVYAKAGYGKADVEVTAKFDGDSEKLYDEKETYKSYGIGAKYNVVSNLWVNAEFEKYSFDVESEDVDLDMWSVGVQYMF